jgi:hypothetical protein
MSYVEGASREQQVMFPEVLDEYITADNKDATKSF